MKIICLFAQQRCSYEDEYAPDLRAAIDEWSHSHNPQHIYDEEEKLRKDNSIAFWRRIIIEVDDAEFDQLVYPPTKTLKATVITTEEQP